METLKAYTGDGNNGTSFSHDIEANDIDAAVEAYMQGVDPAKRDLFDWSDNGDGESAVGMVYEDADGSTAGNGGAFFVVEIYPAYACPRV